MKVFAALLLLAAVAGCSSSGGSPHATDSKCDQVCQSDLAAADGSTLPPGPAFDLATSKCSLWNQEPSTVRYYLIGLYAVQFGAKSSTAPVTFTLQKTVDVTCKSYTDDTVKSVVKVLVKADDQWPDA